MNRYAILSEEWQRLIDKNKQLEEEYRGKTKGAIYTQKKLDLVSAQEKIKQKALAIGSSGTVCKITGKMQRPHLKNPKILVTQRFTIYFTDISDTEAGELVKLHIKNLIHYKIEFIKPGKILTTD